MGMVVFQQKEPKMPGAHKIGAATCGPRIAGGNFMDTTFFLGDGPNTVSGSTVSNTELSEFFGAH